MSTQTYPKQYPFLTRQEFDVAAKSFLEQSKNVVGEGFGYLSRKMIIQKVNAYSNEFKTEDITPITTDVEQFEQVEEVEDPDGTPLTIDEIYSCLIQPSRLEDIKVAGFHGGISQQDHPTLLIPFYYLHPCETATLMKSIVDRPRSTKFNSDNNNLLISLEGYIRSWLSLIGNVVGIKIEIDYFL
ncbi:9567_t:CDS:2 [Funneliformis mosseae]|uniref:Ubiquitin-like-conjugating enzyme ATG10 n=1 Tax=Funneliformis mosseae TaxID=27381 RepID=A0A9N9GP56_FUNMO|nr:9567_t:CDS:2 [Funneliformis mosseae]